MDYYNGVEPSAGSATPMKKLPERGVKLFFYLLWTHFTKVLFANALFLLFSLPLVTVPAALSALSRIFILLIRDGYVNVWQDFIKEFKTSFLKSTAIGVVYAVFTALMYLASKVYPRVNGISETGGAVIFSAAVALMLLASAAACYAFSMNAQFNLKMGAIIKNSLLLLFYSLKNTFVLIALSIAFNFVVIYFFPGSMPLPLTFFIAAYQLAVCVTVKTPFEKYLMPKKEE